MDDAKEIGTRIRTLRKNRRMTMETICRHTGLDQGNLSRIENGKTRPGIETLGRLASALDASIDDLLGDGGRFQGGPFGPVKTEEIQVIEKPSWITSRTKHKNLLYYQVRLRSRRVMEAVALDLGDILVASPKRALFPGALVILQSKAGKLHVAQAIAHDMPDESINFSFKTVLGVAVVDLAMITSQVVAVVIAAHRKYVLEI